MEQDINTQTPSRSKKKILPKVIAISILIIGAATLGFYFWQKNTKEVKPPYTQTYRLLPEKISQSAVIPVSLPPNVDENFAKGNVKFNPTIEGQWLATTSQDSIGSRVIFFTPNSKLSLNRYYQAELIMPDGGLIKGDFMSVEDPQIIAVFPKKDSEAPENSEITIVFNRPMVPLTTLSELEEKDVPVEITPKTEGRFKWITTRNLQFIPKDRLIRSSNYKVTIKDGLVSMDGLGVKSTETNFTTRKLRYLHSSRGQIIYNEPVAIYFNQPVDLEKTKGEISLTDNKTGNKIPFILEYKNQSLKTDESRKSGGLLSGIKNFLADISYQMGLNFFPRGQNQADADQSVLLVYNEKDRFGREKFWDFENSYTVNINKAYPLEGDIILNQSNIASINVAGVIKNIGAESDKTQYASVDFFDPQGKLYVEFYEDISLEESVIISQKIDNIYYAEKCKDEQQQNYNFSSCEKVQDKRKIYIEFRAQDVGRGENMELAFEKIVNSQGLTINKEKIKRIITSYPEFKIFSTSPANLSKNAKLTTIVLCTNIPLVVPEKKDFGKFFTANPDYEINNWGKSFRVWYKDKNEACNNGEFHTNIYYGLIPLSDYEMSLNLEDVFSQKKNYNLSFSTGPMDGQYLEFYHLQSSYNVTSPQKTKLTFAEQNMDYVYLQICKLDAGAFLYQLQNRISYNAPTLISDCQKVAADKITLPKKYWLKNYFNVDLKDYFPDPIGHYILTFTNPNYTGYTWQAGKKIQTPIYQRSYLTITNLAVTEKKIQAQLADWSKQPATSTKQFEENVNNLYWVTDFSSSQGIENAVVSLYRGGSKTPSNFYYTDAQGIAKTKIVYDLKGAVISKDGDSTVIPSYESSLDWADSAYLAKKIYLYTDKPIYRPTQEVFIKGLYRIGYDGSYEIYKDKKINLKVYNSKYDEIFNQDVNVSDFGTIDAKLALESNSPLGTYRICADSYNCSYFDVEEYVPAAFEVKVQSDKEEYVSKDTVNLDIDANYYFGVPLEGGEVEYTISSQNYYFDRWGGEYFDFGPSWWENSYGDRFISRGSATLSAEGKAKISAVLDWDKIFKNQSDKTSKIIVFDITVKNSQGQSISAQKSFVLHAAEFYLGISSDKSFVGKNEKFNLKVKSVDLKGKEIRVNNAKLSLYETDWIYSKRQEVDGSYNYTWEKKRELVQTYNFDTDEKGNYSKEVALSKEGEYEAEVSATDKNNNTFITTYYLYVYGDGHVSVMTTKDPKLEIEVKKNNLNVGDEGEIVIKSPYPKAKALISIERGKIFSYEVKEIDGNLYDYKFKVKEEYLPNIYVSVLLLSSNPEVKFGNVNFLINTRKKALDIQVKSDKTSYLPGEEVTLDITAKDYEGNPVSAEMSVAVVDLSVLALKGNPKKDPLVFFYSGFPLTVSTASNIKNILIETDISTKGGGGGSDEASERGARGLFMDTAFWQSSVTTDNSGNARVKFKLPDNLTTWRTETIGITKDTKLGVNYQEFMVRKSLMLVPLKPRFVVPGDEFYIGAKIFNQSETKQKLSVKFESQTLVLNDDDAEKNITLGIGETQTVYFSVLAPNNIEDGEHKFLLSAQSKDLQDSVIQYIDITPNDTYEVTATANYTTDSTSKEYVFLPDNVIKDKGSLSIKSSATLAVFLSNSLNYLLSYPYGCTEQVASKLDAIAIVKRGLNLPNLGDKLKLDKIEFDNKKYTIEEAVIIGLAKLYNNQNQDGGFSYWGRGESDFYLTLHITDTLYNLSLAGFSVNKNSLNKAAGYLDREMKRGVWLGESLNSYRNRLILTTYTLMRMPNFEVADFYLQKITSLAKDNLFMNDQISNSSLSYLSILLTNKSFPDSLRTKVNDALDNRVNIDSRGSFIEPNKNFLWYYYETPVKDTALYLKALSANKSKNPIIDKTLRWLLNSRQKDGAWGSTNNTISVIDALTDFLQWKRETESKFNLDILVNDKNESSFTFAPDTILDQLNKELPLSSLKFNENNVIQFSKKNNNWLDNAVYYDMALKYYLPADQIAPRDEGFSVNRSFYALDDKENKSPLSTAKAGDVLRAHLQIVVPKSSNFVTIEDYIPAGMEIVNLKLATEQKSLLLQETEIGDNSRELYPDFTELHDDRAFVYKKQLQPGVYEFDYFVRALTPGKFIHLPAIVSEMYFPENFGRTAGEYFEIK